MELTNFKTLMANTRTRVVLIFTFATLIIAAIVGIGLFSRSTDTSTASVGAVPKVHSVVGGFDHPVSPEYARLLREQNKQQADMALQTHGSSVPTIINAQSFPGSPAPQGCACANCAAGASSALNLQKTGPVPMGAVCSDGTVRDASGKIIGRTGIIAPGGLVYDAKGKVIGKVGPDGQVRDARGRVIGTLSQDGTVRDANGNIIGTTGTYGAHTPTEGNLAYDNAGHLLGTVGADGKIHDANGNIVGEVSSDGTVRDASGKIIGKVLAGSQVGQVAYDDKGNVLGTVGADGKVRDAQGNIVGSVDADGKVRDATGKIIGKIPTSQQSPRFAYDATGRVIGMVGADGKVRDASGRVIGTASSDGTVRDNLGNVIGTTKAVTPGAAVYDSLGHLIGVVGADGKVRDSNGNVIGTVGADGVVRNAAGVPIGRTSYIAPGSAVYGADGKLIGTVGADGRLVPAAVGPSGSSQDLLTGGQDNARDQASLRQQQILQQQKASQLTAQLQGAMAGQMNALQIAWTPPTQSVVVGNTSDLTGAGGSKGGASDLNQAVLYKAGSVIFATIDTAVNSDEPGPVMATITSGKLKGGKLLGTFVSQGEKAMLTFTTLSMPSAPRSVAVNTVAIDPATARTALSSDTNNHYLLRYGTLFAATFLSGYAQAISQSGSQTTITLQGITHEIPPLSARQKLMLAMGNVGQQYTAVLNNVYNTPPTIKIYAGTGVGILFLSDLATSPGLTSDE